MSAIRNPQVKKDASLKRDHRVYPRDGDKSFRGAWKKKKQRMAKQARASGKVGIRLTIEGEDNKISAKPKQPKSLRKTGLVTLRRDLEIKQTQPPMRFSMFDYSCDEFTR